MMTRHDDTPTEARTFETGIHSSSSSVPPTYETNTFSRPAPPLGGFIYSSQDSSQGRAGKRASGGRGGRGGRGGSKAHEHHAIQRAPNGTQCGMHHATQHCIHCHQPCALCHAMRLPLCAPLRLEGQRHLRGHDACVRVHVGAHIRTRATGTQTHTNKSDRPS